MNKTVIDLFYDIKLTVGESDGQNVANDVVKVQTVNEMDCLSQAIFGAPKSLLKGGRRMEGAKTWKEPTTHAVGGHL